MCIYFLQALQFYCLPVTVLLSPFRPEMLETSQMWFTIHRMTVFEIAPRAGCIWYHVRRKDLVVSGVKVDIIQATVSASVFLLLFLLFSLLHFIFNLQFRCVLKLLLSELCFICIKIRDLAQDWAPVPSCCFPFRAPGKHLLGIDEGLLDQVDSTGVWCEYGSKLNIWDTPFVMQVVNILGTSPSGRMNWPSSSQWTTVNGEKQCK